MKVDPNEPAFPFGDIHDCSGLTKREWMAAMIMAGLAADTNSVNGNDSALVAVMWADTLIAELNKEKQ